ncbi:beta strand repeat-containing protein [Maribacter sp. R77961]|uniref:beta strand repeat-containing protein n=1 Tax=Maribacter sp. R77961 TaxID=3093871 RepID=UPI0037C74C3F
MLNKVYFLIFIFSTLIVQNVKSQETFRDNFSAVSYGNNNGTQNFSSNWFEQNDDGSPNSGDISINSNQLRFRNMDDAWIYRFIPLAGASSVTLTLDYNANSRGNEQLDVYIYNSDTFNWNLVESINTTNTGTITYNLTAAEIASNPAIIFFSDNNNWDATETIFIDNVQFSAQYSPTITVNDIDFNETDGTVSITATHASNAASGAFTVNYQTTDISTSAGTDYIVATGTLNFNGTVGDTDTITLSILDDGLIEGPEDLRIEFVSSSDPTVDFTDTATITIRDNEVESNTPLSLFREYNGYYDYALTGGSMRDEDNSGNTCSIVSTSSNTLTTTVPATAQIEQAYLFWTHSGTSPDLQVTLEGQNIDADFANESFIGALSFYSMIADVTTLIESMPIGSISANTFDFSDLNVDNTGSYCSGQVTLGGWSLMIFYEEASLPAVSLNLYQGFQGYQNTTSPVSFTLDGFYAIASSGAKTTILSWEGDQSITGGEQLSITTTLGTNKLTGDGDNDGISVDNPYNSTIFDNTVLPNINNTTTYGLDLDTYDISSFIAPAESSVTTNVEMGGDFVLLNGVVIKVPSNLITGTVFEDVNYPGGAGRDISTAGGIPIEGVSVELYNSSGSLVDTQLTDENGLYVFGGIPNDTYALRVVNSTVTSNRGGGDTCSGCYPVQTFRRFDSGAGLTDVVDEVGGANPANEDSALGTLTGAQSASTIFINASGIIDVDFGFNFNTIVNTNEDGQGSLEQFIVNANNLDETGLDIDANSIFDPAPGIDTSIFMIPPTGDSQGRTADVNYNGAYFDILVANGNPFSNITAANTSIDGRTQTSYSGNTNSGTVGSGGTVVGTSGITLPNYDLPEIQIHRNGGDVLRVEANGVTIRNLSIFANNNAAIRVNSGSAEIAENVLGVDATGNNAGNIDFGVENQGGDILVRSNYIATVTDAGVYLNGGSSSIIENNHFFSNGATACDDNIEINSGGGIIIQQNLIENSGSLGIDAENIAGNVSILNNTITGAGQNGGNCSGSVQNYGVRLSGNDSEVSNNVIFNNGGAGLIIVGNPGENGNLISQNSFFNNGTDGAALGIDLVASGTVPDGITINDLNDADTGPNDLVNFPIIESANISSTSVSITGWARSGATIEFFLTDISEGTAVDGDNQLGLSTDYGEGQVFIGSFVEGSAADTNANTSSYLDEDSNTDNTNQFTFTFNTPSGVTLGKDITATATVSNSTSEFSPMSKLKTYTIITNRRITYRVKKN